MTRKKRALRAKKYIKKMRIRTRRGMQSVYDQLKYTKEGAFFRRTFENPFKYYKGI